MLDLPGGLLGVLVGHEELGNLAADHDAEPVVIGEVTVVADREVGSSGEVGVVLYYRWI